MFPPGRARLVTNPEPTGSESCAMTMGIVEVASLAARVAVGPPVTITSTLRRTSSAASAGRRSGFPSARRHSTTSFFPRHTQARAGHAGIPRCGPRQRKWWQQLGIRSAGLSPAAAPRQKEQKQQKSKAHKRKTKNFFLHDFSSSCFRLLTAHLLFNHLIRPRQHIRRNRQADLLRGFQIDDQLELCRLLDGQIGGLGAFQNLVHIRSGAAGQVGEVCRHRT